MKTVVSLHGIRTHAKWQRALAELAQQNGWACPLEKWDFGYFSLLRFVLPWQRETKVRWFRATYEDLLNDRNYKLSNENRPSIVAHSFGTYILGYSLLKYANLRFDKVILCGSILPVNFPWDKIIERGQIDALRNEYGVSDVWVKLVRWFVSGTGRSGQNGFACRHDGIEQDEFHFDHSEYFEKGHMREFWVPFMLRSTSHRPVLPVYAPIPRPPVNRPWGLYGLYLVLALSTLFVPSQLSRGLEVIKSMIASSENIREDRPNGLSGNVYSNYKKGFTITIPAIDHWYTLEAHSTPNGENIRFPSGLAAPASTSFLTDDAVVAFASKRPAAYGTQSVWVFAIPGSFNSVQDLIALEGQRRVRTAIPFLAFIRSPQFLEHAKGHPPTEAGGNFWEDALVDRWIASDNKSALLAWDRVTGWVPLRVVGRFIVGKTYGYYVVGVEVDPAPTDLEREVNVEIEQMIESLRLI